MANRLNLHEEFATLLGSNNVYFQPPESVKLNYPCIKYSRVGIDSKKADDMNYKNTNRYEVIVIDKDPDSEIPYKILTHFKMCGFDRWYPADNLNHFVFTIFY